MAVLKKGLRSRRLRLLLGIVLLVFLLPYLLVLAYRFVNPVSTLMVWRWFQGQRVERSYLPLAQIAPTLPVSVIVAEDGRYCSHHGIDFRELRGMVEEAESLDDLRGASTITQQTVKNLFLWQGRSVARKIVEFPLALWTDLVLPKRRILEIYLNIAEWGPTGQFGAEAAARTAFGKSARQLSPAEAGLLAAILPNPIARSARQPRRDVRRLGDLYMRRAAASPWAADCIRSRQNP
jgi:monofunctional glycosyltransferase